MFRDTRPSLGRRVMLGCGGPACRSSTMETRPYTRRSLLICRRRCRTSGRNGVATRRMSPRARRCSTTCSIVSFSCMSLATGWPARS